MRRSMDLILAILRWMEEQPGTWCNPAKASLPGYEDKTEKVAYHVDLCVEAGFVRSKNPTSANPHSYRLTWNGHERLAESRAD